MAKIREYTSNTEALASYQHVTLKSRVDGTSRSLPPPYSRRSDVLEAEILKQCKQVMLRNGFFVRRIDGVGKVIAGAQGATMVPGELRGMPDLIAIKDGKFYGIEVKAPGGKVSSVQYATLKGIQEAGGIVCIACTPHGLESFLNGATIETLISGWLPVV